MAKGSKLLKDTLLYGVANFGAKILTFIMLPFYTHYFSTTEYGTWDLVLTTTSLLVPFITFELVVAVYRWLINEKDDDKKKNIITTGIIAIIRNLLIFNLIAIVICLFISIPYSWGAIILINVSIASSFIQQCARGLGYNKLFAFLGIIQTVIALVLNLFFMFILDLRLEAFFYSQIIAGLCVFVYAWKRMRFGKYISMNRFSGDLVKNFLVYSIPIIPGTVSWWVMNMSDRYLISIYLGMEMNGIYAVANKIPSLLLIINTVFYLAWKDSAIREFDSNDKNDYYSKVFKHFFRLMTTSVILLILLTRPVLETVISSSFIEAWKYIGILLLGALFSSFSQFWGAGYHGAKKTNVIFVTSFVGALINLIVNLLLINIIGLYAVAISTFLAFLSMWLIRVLYTNQYFKIKVDYKDMIILFPLIIVSLIIPFIFDKIGLFISIFIAFLVFYLFNKDIIKIGIGTLSTRLKKSTRL